MPAPHGTASAAAAPAEPTVVLALDVGEARIGLARGELGGRLAFGRGALRRSGRQGDDVAAVAGVAAAEGAGLVLVGLPLRAQGGDSAQTQRVRAFAAALRAAGLRVEFLDERFTTALAQRQLATSDLPRGKRRDKSRVDEAAAIAILETYQARHAEAADAVAGRGAVAGCRGGETEEPGP